MRKLTLLLALLGALATLAGVSAAQAATTETTLPEYNGTFSAGPFPLPAVTVGTFAYSIPAGEVIVGATISGSFGNSTVSNSAGVDLFLNGVLVAQCVQLAACYAGTDDPTPWSHTFSAAEAQSLLASGSADLTAVQTSASVIRLGATTLTIHTEEQDSISKQDCKDGKWATLDLGFKNQGDCVSYVATGGKNQPASSGVSG